MNTYLQLFRDQAFSASIQLFKRILGSSFLASVILGILGLILTMPLILVAFGYGPFDITKYQAGMLEFQNSIMQASGDPEAMRDIYMNFISSINYPLIGLVVVIILVLYSWGLNLYYIISDNEIRTGNPMFSSAFRQSLSKRIIRIIGFFLLFTMIQIATFLIFGLLFGLIISFSKALAIFAGFVGFLFLIVFYLRFTIVLAAMIHGNKSITESISYSLSHINWKRGWMLLLIGILVTIVMAIVGGLVTSAASLAGTVGIGNFILLQALNLIVNGFFLSYIIAATSTLYFRYSDDSLEEDNLESHIVE